MSKYQCSFKRYELKYLINENQYNQLMERFQDRLKIDEYGETKICNIYFDTPDYRLIRTSLEKPVYKEKLRLRSYNTPTKGDMVFVEIKKKFKGIVYKRRVKMTLSQAERYLYDRGSAPASSQIISEIDWFLHSYDQLMPKMYLSYDRIALYGKDDNQLRVTFDRNIGWREDALYLSTDAGTTPILHPDERLMEIKIPGAMPLWLSHILSELNIYPTSFSKYGRGYVQACQINKLYQRKGEKKYA